MYSAHFCQKLLLLSYLPLPFIQRLALVLPHVQNLGIKGVCHKWSFHRFIHPWFFCLSIGGASWKPVAFDFFSGFSRVICMFPGQVLAKYLSILMTYPTLKCNCSQSRGWIHSKLPYGRTMDSGNEFGQIHQHRNLCISNISLCSYNFWGFN